MCSASHVVAYSVDNNNHSLAIPDSLRDLLPARKLNRVARARDVAVGCVFAQRRKKYGIAVNTIPTPTNTNTFPTKYG
jgi:hypothetical protein